MVKITLEYGSVEEAIQALGKLSGLAKVRRAASPEAAAGASGGAPVSSPEQAPGASAPMVPAGVAPQAPAAATTRKGRNDKGKPRGPHKKAYPAVEGGTAASVGSAAGDTAAGEKQADPVVVAQAAEPESTPSAAAPAPSTKDAEKALEGYFTKHGAQKAMALLASFGVSKLRELPEGERAAFIAKCGE